MYGANPHINRVYRVKLIYTPTVALVFIVQAFLVLSGWLLVAVDVVVEMVPLIDTLPNRFI